MSLVQQIKELIGVSSNDYDTIIIIFSCVMSMYLVKSLFSLFYKIFKGD